jgi:hypothetical protein
MNRSPSFARLAFSVALSLFSLACPGGENLLKNGSFEGGKRYWYEADAHTLVKGDAAQGEYSLRIDTGGIASAAFLLQQGRPVTFSFSAKSIGGGATMGWQLTPCSREIGTRNNLTWSMRHFHPVAISAEWKRYSFTFTPTVPQDGFWPTPTYMVQIGDCDRPFLIDAVTVAYDAGSDAYVPRREIEVQADSPDLKGYTDESGNLFEKGATVHIAAIASNPGPTERSVSIRWQLIDYEGVQPIGEAVETKVTIPAGKVISETKLLKLSATGLVLARVSVFADGKLADSSDLPLCSLAYPVESTKPNPNERFGGSLFGTHNAKLVGKMGFAWSRWRPHMEWQDHQPDGPDTWIWADKQLDELESLGFSSHFVMFGKPKWAFASEHDLLPKDMQWPVSDPRWDDLTPACAWDRFVVESVKHYIGRSLVYEIENEPEFDWPADKKELYAKFTIRSARLIKQANPAARVMVNNVYGIPSGINRYLLEQGAGKFIDIISWHDYHEGWLADASAIRRMRGNLDELGCKHIEIWFNEGWAFTNTAVDDPAVALTHLNAAQSTNAMVDSVAEMTVAGQEKTVLFHTGYEEHGMSFWDYYGPGTMLWDYYGYPMPLVPAWNTLVHHIGLSERVAFIRPEGANFCVFQDLRDGRGVVVAYVDREAKTDASIALPMDGLIAEDAMGNATPVMDRKLTLSKSGRPVFVYSPNKTSGAELARMLLPLDRKNSGFVSGNGKQWKLPSAWEGSKKAAADGNPAVADGMPVWRVDQVWPDDPTMTSHYTPLQWNGTAWAPEKNGSGGQPEVKVESGAIDIAVRGSWTGNEGQRIAGLIFVAPKAGKYRVEGQARTNPWAGGAKTYKLGIFKKDTQRATQEKVFELPRDGSAVKLELAIDLTKGHELVILPLMPDWHNATHTAIEQLTIELIPDSAR